jgi:hypothetical protein
MRNSDREDFCLTIAAMATTYRQEATKALYEGYWQGLKDLPLEAVRLAVTRALRESRFLPTVAELRELAGVVTPEDRCVQVWEVVRRAVYRFGYYTSVDFDDPLTNATIRNLGGWPALQERLEKDDDQWVRKDFDRIYASLARSGISEEMAAPLMGESERSKRLHGRQDLMREPERIACGLSVVPVLPGPTNHAALTAEIGAGPPTN